MSKRRRWTFFPPPPPARRVSRRKRSQDAGEDSVCTSSVVKKKRKKKTKKECSREVGLMWWCGETRWRKEWGREWADQISHKQDSILSAATNIYTTCQRFNQLRSTHVNLTLLSVAAHDLFSPLHLFADEKLCKNSINKSRVTWASSINKQHTAYLALLHPAHWEPLLNIVSWLRWHRQTQQPVILRHSYVFCRYKEPRRAYGLLNLIKHNNLHNREPLWPVTAAHIQRQSATFDPVFTCYHSLPAAHISH